MSLWWVDWIFGRIELSNVLYELQVATKGFDKYQIYVTYIRCGFFVLDMSASVIQIPSCKHSLRAQTT